MKHHILSRKCKCYFVMVDNDDRRISGFYINPANCSEVWLVSLVTKVLAWVPKSIPLLANNPVIEERL